MSLLAPGFDDDPAPRRPHGEPRPPDVPDRRACWRCSGLVVGMLNPFEHFRGAGARPGSMEPRGSSRRRSGSCRRSRRTTRSTPTRSRSSRARSSSSCPRCRGCADAAATSRSGSTGATSACGVLKLMLPVTIALGLINLSLLINSLFGTLVSPEALAAIDKAFRIYQLPQGLFSIAWRRSCSRPGPASPPAAHVTTCAARWARACARPACS